MTWGFVLSYTRAGFLDGDDWGGGDRPEGSDDDDDDEDQEEEDQAEGRPYARPITPALGSRGRRFRGAFQGTTAPVV